MDRVLLEKLTVPHAVNETLRFMEPEVHNNPSLVHVVPLEGQINPVHALPSYCQRRNRNIHSVLSRFSNLCIFIVRVYVDLLLVYVDLLLVYVDLLLVYVDLLLVYVFLLSVYVDLLLVYVDLLLVYVDLLLSMYSYC